VIIVTGGAGFIGSNLVYALNQRGLNDILIIDNLTNGEKCKNLNALDFHDYLDKNKFSEHLAELGAKADVIFHIGACSDTMEYNGKYMMENNYEYSKNLLHFCQNKNIPFIYASSASVYGNGIAGFTEDEKCENSLNTYAFSKMQFDRYVRKILTADAKTQKMSQIVGLRFFNVFGPQENHKGRMASIFYQMYNQLNKNSVIRLFAAHEGYADGEQKRDFIYVKDVVKVNLYFWDNPRLSGIFNCGTGKAETFNAAATSIIKAQGTGKIEYIPFPAELQGKYQSFTEADTKKLLQAGYDGGFYPLEKAAAEYYEYLEKNDGYLK
jgi:ADP-L-glycero-D-manno-heptose 6-epimerase